MAKASSGRLPFHLRYEESVDPNKSMQHIMPTTYVVLLFMV